MIGHGLHEDLPISRENMTKHIEEEMPKNIFEDGKLRIIELKYKDIKLDMYIRNNTVQENPNISRQFIYA